MGDRINWEILLEQVADGTDLHLISKDGDFGSPLLAAANSYPIDEWQTKKGGNLALHDQLKPFLAQHFPQIHLAIDVEKRVAIERLINSGSFAMSHRAISSVQPFVDVLTPTEIAELIRRFGPAGAPASNTHSHPRRCACGNNPICWADSGRVCS
jgi:hypothetical protein